jgi:hypothetical protein
VGIVVVVVASVIVIVLDIAVKLVFANVVETVAAIY